MMKSRSLTAAEIQTLEELRLILKQRKPKRLPAIIATFISVVVTLYALPVGIESLLLRHVSPWACILVGDMAGCAVLFLLGHKVLAAMLYFIATAFEAYLLAVHSVSSESLVWITNLLPALAVAYLILTPSSVHVGKGRPRVGLERSHGQASSEGRGYTVARRG